jgi:NADPH-dependent ferric siderophore reductase
LPAIARRLAELPAGTRVVAVCEVDGPDDVVALPTQADATVTWVYRGGIPAGESDGLARALGDFKQPPGDYYAWIACESVVAKALRRQLITERAANPKWMRAAGYWRRGAVAVHETHED